MLPEVKYIRPGLDISWLIKQFEIIRYNNITGLTDKFVPREDASIVFHFGDMPWMTSPVNQSLPRFFIAPLTPKANSIRISGHTDSLIVTCIPTVLSRVLGMSLEARSSIYVPLPEYKFHPVWEKMKTQDTIENRIQTFSSFIKDLHHGKYIPDKTDLIYDTFLQKGRNTPLHSIISDLDVSERTVQRRFRNRLGASPKGLIRIMRINDLWNTISRDDRIDYQDLVFLGNYFDQTHLIKDFKSITGETPDTFFRRNLGVARIFSGK